MKTKGQKISETKLLRGPSQKFLNAVSGENNWLWKGDSVEYSGGHSRVQRACGKAVLCENPKCEKISTRFEWANISGKYHDVFDYKQLCKVCHIDYDGTRSEAKVHLRMIEFKGKKRSLAQWARLLGIKASTITSRLSYGYSIERAFTPTSRILIKHGGKYLSVREFAAKMGTCRQTVHNRIARGEISYIDKIKEVTKV